MYIERNTHTHVHTPRVSHVYTYIDTDILMHRQKSWKSLK